MMLWTRSYLMLCIQIQIYNKSELFECSIDAYNHNPQHKEDQGCEFWVVRFVVVGFVSRPPT
jgi:hypothetical protein